MLYPTASKPSAGNFELWSWLFMRVSGVILLVMVLLHFAIMHVLTPLDNLTYSFVADRFATPFWRVYDLVLLILAMVHGVNGTRVVADDWIHTRGWRLITMSFIYVLGFLFLVIGSQILLSFQPVASR